MISAIRAHFIRPCYLRESETPLKFYKLIRVCLPIGAVLNFFRAIQATVAISTAAEAAKPYFIIDAIYMWLGIVLLLGAAAGLNRMEWSGVRFYSALFGWQIVYNAFLAILGARWGLFDFEYFGRPIMEVIFLSVWLYFCMIYFGKRRLLFSPGAFETPCVSDEPQNEPEKADPVQPDPSPVFQEAPPETAVELPPAVQESPPADLAEVKKQKRKPNVLMIVLCIALALSLAGNVWQGVSWASDSAESSEEIRVLNNKIQQKEEAISTYRTRLEEMDNLYSILSDQHERLEDFSLDAVFLYESIGFIVDGSSYYHKFDCPVYRSADEYTAHNIEYCRYLGYRACPVCWD